MKTFRICLFVVLLLSCGQALAQDKRVSCDILKQIDLKPLLGVNKRGQGRINLIDPGPFWPTSLG